MTCARRILPSRIASAVLVAALLLAGCSSDGRWRGLETLGSDTLGLGDEPAPITAAAIDAIPSATIVMRFEDAAPALMAALAINRDRVTYLSKDRRTLTMVGGLVVLTRGLAEVLDGVRFATDDPIARPRALDAWPELSRRVYYLADGERRRQHYLTCRWRRGAVEAREILGAKLSLTRVDERCGNRRVAMANAYWVEPKTGQIWRSVQRLGPGGGRLLIEVGRPVAAPAN